VPRRSCLGYRHAGCLQLNHRRPPEMARRDFCHRRTAIGGGISSRRPRGDSMLQHDKHDSARRAGPSVTADACTPGCQMCVLRSSEFMRDTHAKRASLRLTRPKSPVAPTYGQLNLRHLPPNNCPRRRKSASATSTFVPNPNPIPYLTVNPTVTLSNH